LYRNKNNSSSGRSKSGGRCKSLEKSLKKCWKCGKVGHFRKDCRSKVVERENSSNDVPFIEGKASLEEGGNVYLGSSITHEDHDVWMINLGDFFHMIPHRERLCEYEKYNGGEIFQGYDSTTIIMGHGKVKLQLKDGRIRTLPRVLHIPELTRNLIYVSKMSDVGVHTMFEKETCKMIQGAIVLMTRVCNETLYMLLRSTISNGCNGFFVLKGEEDKTLMVSREKTMLWYQILGHIGEKGIRALHGKGMVEGMFDFSLDFDSCEYCIYGK